MDIVFIFGLHVPRMEDGKESAMQKDAGRTPGGPGHSHTHHHLWIVGVTGMAAGLFLLLYVPSLAAISGSIMLFAGFHLIGGIVLLASAYLTLPKRWSRFRRSSCETYDFGWAPGWVFGPGLAALVAASAAIVLEVTMPEWWPLALILTGLAASFFAGFVITRSTTRKGSAVLPMVDLFTDGAGTVLDAGCGAGRTTIAIGRASGPVSIVALDRFDADYIQGGGRHLLENNLRLAGLRERVTIETGDLTALPFGDESFDAVVSAHAVDHLGENTKQGLSEVWRVLKRGRRFLMVVWVPGWTMFAIANVLCLSLKRRGHWLKLAGSAGFKVVDHGTFGGNFFLLLEKPVER